MGDMAETMEGAVPKDESGEAWEVSTGDVEYFGDEPDGSFVEVQEIANIPVVFTHYGHGEITITTDMPQIPALGEKVSFDSDEVSIGTVFAVVWAYSAAQQHWHAEVSIR